MAEFRQPAFIYINTQQARRVSSDNFPVRETFRMFLRSQVLFSADLWNDDGTAFLPESGSLWEFHVDNVFGPGQHDDLVISDNDQFNIIDDRSDLDVDGGKISWRVNLATTELDTAMGTDQSKTMWGELWVTAPGTSTALLMQLEFTMQNIVSEVGSTSGLDYLSDAIWRWDGDALVGYYPDGSVAVRYTKD